MTPTQRTLALLRKEGWTAEVCERWNPHARIRQDLFGIADIVAVRRGEMLLVQCTAGSCHSARIKKALALPVLQVLLTVPGLSFAVWSWRKAGAAGKRKVWACRREKMVLSAPDPTTGGRFVDREKYLIEDAATGV